MRDFHIRKELLFFLFTMLLVGIWGGIRLLQNENLKAKARQISQEAYRMHMQIDSLSGPYWTKRDSQDALMRELYADPDNKAADRDSIWEDFKRSKGYPASLPFDSINALHATIARLTITQSDKNDLEKSNALRHAQYQLVRESKDLKKMVERKAKILSQMMLPAIFIVVAMYIMRLLFRKVRKAVSLKK